MNQAQRMQADLERDGYLYGDTKSIVALADSFLGARTPGGDLRPNRPDEAQETHSGVFGLGEFPWHTDGAIALNPPRWVLLHCKLSKAKATTELYRPTEPEIKTLGALLLRTQNSVGQVRYLPAISVVGSLRMMRWDSRACPPTNAELANVFDGVAATNSVEWQEGFSLIFDNFKYLHRRSRVTGGRSRHLVREYIY